MFSYKSKLSRKFQRLSLLCLLRTGLPDCGGAVLPDLACGAAHLDI